MNPRVGIIGVGQTRYEQDKRKQNLTEIIFEAASKAVADAHMSIEDIGSVVLAAHDLVDGVAVTTASAGAAAGAHLKSETRVCDDGAFGVAMACLEILSGSCDTVLVVSWSKCSDCNLDIITNLNFDPFFYRPIGLNELTVHACQAMCFMNKYDITEDQAAMVTTKNRSNALHNPLAHLQTEVGINDVLRSRVLSWPLKELDIPPRSDGACAIVLAAEEQAKQSSGAVAWIRGMGWATDGYNPGDRDMSQLPSLSLAAKKAYHMAGITDPLNEVDVAEIHDVTSFHELMEYQALGFCAPGQAGQYIEQGIFHIDGRLPVNPSGGVLSSNPYVATGLVRVAEAALQVTGRAQGHQVHQASTALAHGISGLCAQSNCVFVLATE